MKGYQKAAVFIAVLLFSVSLISEAIDILGDIDLDMEQIRKTETEPAGTVETGPSEGELLEPLPLVSRIQTVTNITDNDAVGVKGGYFKVYGTVTTHNGSPVDGLAVQVFLTESKNQTSAEWERRIECGLDEVEEGFFNITCEASVDLEVGDYMLVAHTIGNEVYEGSWSDPPIRIMAETEVSIKAPRRAHVGESITLRGSLIDRSNGQPIANLTVLMEMGNETVSLITDSAGTVTMDHAFDTEGRKTAVIRFEESDYYFGSMGVVGIKVKTHQPSLLSVLTVFPYNVIVVSACAAIVGCVLVVRQRRRRQPLQAIEEGALVTENVEDETPLSFDSYKDGIVKLFNRFYTSTQRRFSEVKGCLTPREFQRVLLGKIPGKGMHPLDDLVTAFEIANYSEAYPPKEAYDRCQMAVEILRGLIEHG